MDIFGGIRPLEQGLNASWTRSAVIQNNIANDDTPGFKASKVRFEDMFAKALDQESDFKLKRTRPTHMQIGTGGPESVAAITERDNSTSWRMDGNNVDIDKQMTDFAKNIIYYNALTRKVTGQMGQLRMAIREGR